MEKYNAFVRKLNTVMLAIGAAFIAFVILLTFVQVVLRNVVGFSFTWAEELSRYIVIYAVYFASGTIFYTDANAKVDIIYNTFKPNVKCILNCIFYVLIAAFLLIMAYYGYVYVARNLKIWCASIHIPWALPFLSLVLGATNMLLQVPTKFYEQIKKLHTVNGGGEEVKA